ncbi:hypothetical protein V6N13_126099 [Hibiscus sabdariffa]
MNSRSNRLIRSYTRAAVAVNEGSNGIVLLLVAWRIRNMTIAFQLAVFALIATSSILLISVPVVFASPDDVRGRVISWSSAGTCGFKGTRRGTPFAAQTAAGNAIRAVVDQGMQRAEVMIKGPGLGRDAALRAICRSGQADTIGIAMRRALLGEIEGTCITRAKSEKIPHEYSTVVGIQESVHEILMNLKEIVLRGNLYGTRNAFICAKGPGYVTAQDIILPPSVEIVDNTQHIASLTEPIDLCIGLQIERNRGYGIKTPKNFHDGSYPIDAVFMPVRKANHSIHCYGNDNEKQEILFLEIWTNGSLTPKEALHEASRNLIDLFIPFLHVEEENLHLENNQHNVTLPFFSVS